MHFLNSFILIIFMLLNLIFISIQVAVPHSSHSQCEIQPFMVNCYGPTINGFSLLSLKDQLSTHHKGMYFEELLLDNTYVTSLGADVFADVEFENVLISNNERLQDLNENAFKKVEKTKRFTVINNRQLKCNSLYKLANRLQATLVDFDSNLLEELPSFAFTLNISVHSQKTLFQSVNLRRNNITTIQPNAFHLLDAIREIDLSHNKLERISSHAFHFANYHLKEGLKIVLAHNNLTAASFEMNFIEFSNHNLTSLNLDLSYNKIEDLKETVFKPLLMAGNVTLDLTGNKMTCHNAATAWLFKTENSQLAHKTKGITC